MVKVRLTGITTPTEALTAAEAGYDMVALVFDPASRRCQLPAAGALVRQVLPKTTRLVAILRDAPDDLMYEVVRSVKPDIIELQGEETPQRVQMVKHKTGCEVMKTIRIMEPGDLRKSLDYASLADWILFDVRPNKNNPQQDLTQRFDWKLFHAVQLPIPWVLSGGIDAENVQTIVRLSGASYINVCSGVERTPGRKDVAMIQEFMSMAQAA